MSTNSRHIIIPKNYCSWQQRKTKTKQNKNTKQREKNAKDLHQLKKNIYKKLRLPQASIVPYSYCDLYKWQDTTNMKGLSTEHKWKCKCDFLVQPLEMTLIQSLNPSALETPGHFHLILRLLRQKSWLDFCYYSSH